MVSLLGAMFAKNGNQEAALKHLRIFLLTKVVFLAGCGGGPTLAQRQVESAPAVQALQDGQFDDALAKSNTILEKQPQTPEALLVRAITRYRTTATQLVMDGRTVVVGGLEAGGINQRYLHATAKQAEADLALVDQDLAEAQKSSNVALELCLACWKGIDWNGDGRVNHRDELLLQIEVDAHGEPIPEGDPRRTPTFRFDDGDIAWARAYVGFQRAALDIVLAYDFNGVNEVLRDQRNSKRLVLKLVDKQRITEAKARLLEAIDQSAACRSAYLAETDDDREWVPNPRQKNHPMPLDVDQALYDTWGGVLEDLRKIVNGDEGIGVADVADLLKGEIKVSGARGYINIGAMLDHPKDIVIAGDDIEILEKRSNISAVLSTLLGEYYVTSMKPSALPKRLARMKGEIDAHHEDIEHKLRYMFWLN